MKDKPSLRDRILSLLSDGEMTCKDIAANLGIPDDATAVARELNAMRTDTLLDCKQPGRGKALVYWLINNLPAEQSAPQAQVGKNSVSAEPGTALPGGRAVAAKTPSPQAVSPPSAQSDGGNVEHERIAERLEQYEAVVAEIHEICREAGVEPGLVHERVRALAEKMSADLETERLRLAACGVAAVSNTQASVAERITSDNPYYSASYGDVCNSVDREIELREEVEKLRTELAAERQAREALQEQINADPAVDVHAAASGYIVEGPKLKRAIRRNSPEGAAAAAKRHTKSTSARARVYAKVLVGEAIPGAEWRDA